MVVGYPGKVPAVAWPFFNGMVLFGDLLVISFFRGVVQYAKLEWGPLGPSFGQVWKSRMWDAKFSLATWGTELHEKIAGMFQAAVFSPRHTSDGGAHLYGGEFYVVARHEWSPVVRSPVDTQVPESSP